MRRNMSLMDDDMLIKLVKKYEVIYNRHHSDYKNVERKEQAFSEIASKMGIHDPEMVTKRYRTLRDRFARYHRIKMATGKDKFYLPILDEMVFLKPHIYIKKRPRGYANAHESDESDQTDPLNCSLSMPEENLEVSYLSDMESSSPVAIKQLRTYSKIKLKSQPFDKCDKQMPSTSLEHREVNSKTNSDDAFCEAVTSFKKACKLREERQENTAFNGFREMIMATMAGMTISKQTKAMLRVTEVVMKIKMEN